MSRKDFLSLSAIAGVSTLVGSSTLMTSCGEKGPVYTPLKQPGEYYVPVLNDKADDGKELKALELPGLWNGAMSDWNTVFVEVPIETFNPVKTVGDLLRNEHQM